MDLNEDGHLDILSGSYSNYTGESDDGFFQVLWRQPDGTFAKAKILNGTDGKPLSNMPGLSREVEFEITMNVVGTCPRAADINGDDKLDLIVGNRKGTFFFFAGDGKGSFSPEPEKLMVGDEPLRVSGHSDPFIIDWDQDGDFDIVSGSEAGGVMLSLNEGRKSEPSFQQFIEVIAPYDRAAMHGKCGDSHIHGPCHSTRVCVEDINGDGKLDLLVGDTVNLTYPAEGVDEAEISVLLGTWEKKMEQIQNANSPLLDALFEKLDALGEVEDEATNAKRDVIFEEMDKVTEIRDLHYQKRHEIVREEAVGYIWVYYQK